MSCSIRFITIQELKTNLLATGLSCNKWYQSQTPDNVITRRLTRNGVLARTLSPKRSGLGCPTSIGEGNSASENAALNEGWIVRSKSVGEENETFFIKVWKPLPSRRVSGSSKGKIQRGQYLLIVQNRKETFSCSISLKPIC